MKVNTHQKAYSYLKWMSEGIGHGALLTNSDWQSLVLNLCAPWAELSAFPAEFKTRLLSNRCGPPIWVLVSGRQSQILQSCPAFAPSLFGTAAAQKQCLRGFWQILYWGAWTCFVCLYLPLLIQWHRILACISDYICLRTSKSSKACSCKCLCSLCLHMLFWGPWGCTPLLTKVANVCNIVNRPILACLALLLWSCHPNGAIHPWLQYRFTPAAKQKDHCEGTLTIVGFHTPITKKPEQVSHSFSPFCFSYRWGQHQDIRLVSLFCCLLSLV